MPLEDDDRGERHALLEKNGIICLHVRRVVAIRMQLGVPLVEKIVPLAIAVDGWMR